MTNIKIEVPLLKAALLTTAEYLRQLANVIVEESVDNPAVVSVGKVEVPTTTKPEVPTTTRPEVPTTTKPEVPTTTKPEDADPPTLDTQAELDSMGQPHDSRIHANTKTKVQKAGKFGIGGIWKVTKGTDLARVEEVRAHWISKGYGPHLVEVAKATGGTTAPQAPPAAVAPQAPQAPTRRKLTGQERMLDSAGLTYQSYKDVNPPWTDQQMIDADILSAEEYGDEIAAPVEAPVEAPPVMDFTHLVVSVIGPNLEAGHITQADVDAIVSEVTGGTVATATLIPQHRAEVHIPAIVERVNQLVAANIAAKD